MSALATVSMDGLGLLWEAERFLKLVAFLVLLFAAIRFQQGRAARAWVCLGLGAGGTLVAAVLFEMRMWGLVDLEYSPWSSYPSGYLFERPEIGWWERPWWWIEELLNLGGPVLLIVGLVGGARLLATAAPRKRGRARP